MRYIFFIKTAIFSFLVCGAIAAMEYRAGDTGVLPKI